MKTPSVTFGRAPPAGLKCRRWSGPWPTFRTDWKQASERRVHTQLGLKLQLLSLLVANAHPEKDQWDQVRPLWPRSHWLLECNQFASLIWSQILCAFDFWLLSYLISWSLTTSLSTTTSMRDRDTNSQASRGMSPRPNCRRLPWWRHSW